MNQSRVVNAGKRKRTNSVPLQWHAREPERLEKEEVLRRHHPLRCSASIRLFSHLIVEGSRLEEGVVWSYASCHEMLQQPVAGFKRRLVSYAEHSLTRSMKI